MSLKQTGITLLYILFTNKCFCCITDRTHVFWTSFLVKGCCHWCEVTQDYPDKWNLPQLQLILCLIWVCEIFIQAKMFCFSSQTWPHRTLFAYNCQNISWNPDDTHHVILCNESGAGCEHQPVSLWGERLYNSDWLCGVQYSLTSADTCNLKHVISFRTPSDEIQL